MKRLLLATLFLVPSLALAQQAPQATPREQALTQRLITEINNGLACQTDVLTLQQQIARLQAELKTKDAPADKKQDRLPEKKKP